VGLNDDLVDDIYFSLLSGFSIDFARIPGLESVTMVGFADLGLKQIEWDGV
jgi:hypothetical protein